MTNRPDVKESGNRGSAFAYRTSDAKDDWAQPSVSHYVIWLHEGVVRGQLIHGLYVPSWVATGNDIDPELLAELSAWDSASDEDFAAFEANLE